MNILHITPLYPRKNGIADYAAQYRSVLNSKNGYRLEPYLHDVDVVHCEKQISRLVSIYRITRQLCQEITDGKYNLIHAEIGATCYPEFYTLLFLLSRKQTIPVVITFHDPPHLILHPIQHFGLSGRSLLQRIIKNAISILVSKIMESLIIQRCQYAFCLSETGRALARKRFPSYKNKFIAVPHLPFNDALTPAAKPVFGKSNMILSAGYWTPRRGIEVLLDALDILRARGAIMSEWCICIAGGIIDDPVSKQYYSKIIQRIIDGNWGDKIKTFTDLNLFEYGNLFRDASIFVSSEVQKTKKGSPASGNLLRAISSGCALVVSNVAGINEYVQHGDNGYIFHDSMPDELADALKNLILSKNVREQQQLRNLQLTATKYSTDAIVDTFLTYYLACTNAAITPAS